MLEELLIEIHGYLASCLPGTSYKAGKLLLIKLNWALSYQHPRMVRISGARQTPYLARINRNRLSESRSLTMTMTMTMVPLP
jgi:hypothetical protein